MILETLPCSGETEAVFHVIPNLDRAQWGGVMKLFIAIGSLAGAAFSVCAAETLTFDQAKTGSAPEGWTFTMTHSGGPPKWEIRSDESAPSKPNGMAQVSTDRSEGRFNLGSH